MNKMEKMIEIWWKNKIKRKEKKERKYKERYFDRNKKEINVKWREMDYTLAEREKMDKQWNNNWLKKRMLMNVGKREKKKKEKEREWVRTREMDEKEKRKERDLMTKKEEQNG